jgi:hypothetical protein
MALRHHESAQERLAAEARLLAAADPASRRSPKERLVKTLIRPATAVFSVVLALSALLVLSTPPPPSSAARHMLARPPSLLLDISASQKRMLAADRSGDTGQQLAVGRRVVS